VAEGDDEGVADGAALFEAPDDFADVDGLAEEAAEGVDGGAPAALAENGLAAAWNPSCGSRRKATRPTARAPIPTLKMGHKRGRDGAETARCTPCREEASGTLSNSSRA
jgi:hypothetical protein